MIGNLYLISHKGVYFRVIFLKTQKLTNSSIDTVLSPYLPPLFHNKCTDGLPVMVSLWGKM